MVLKVNIKFLNLICAQIDKILDYLFVNHKIYAIIAKKT
jgi:hypothetical protein